MRRGSGEHWDAMVVCGDLRDLHRPFVTTQPHSWNILLSAPAVRQAHLDALPLFDDVLPLFDSE
jgi:hypothetical protein